MFRTVSLSIIKSLVLYTQQQVYVILKFKKWVKLLVYVHVHFTGWSKSPSAPDDCTV